MPVEGRYDVTENDEGFIFNPPGWEASFIGLGFVFSIPLATPSLSPSPPGCQTKIYGEFHITDNDGETKVDPYDIQSAASAVPRVYLRRLVRIVAKRSGELILTFDPPDRDRWEFVPRAGCTIVVPPDDQGFENWTIRFENLLDDQKWIGLPGGAMTIM